MKILQRITLAHAECQSKMYRDRPSDLYLGDTEFEALKDALFLQTGMKLKKEPGAYYMGMAIHWVEEETHLMCI